MLSSKSRNGQLYAGELARILGELRLVSPITQPASKPFSRHVMVSEMAAEPTPILRSLSNELAPHESLESSSQGHSKRPVQPTHLLRHSFVPIGSQPVAEEKAAAANPDSADVEGGMDVDEPQAEVASPIVKSKKSKRKHDDTKSKPKDPQGESETPTKTKSKKIKLSAEAE